MNFASRTPSLVFVVFYALTAIVCGSKSPASNTPATPASATPAPAPTPVSTPLPGFASCRLGVGTASADCRVDAPTHLAALDQAISRTVQQYPEAFDTNLELGTGGYLVISAGQYLVGVVQNLEAMGYCAYWNGGELQIKDNNDYDDAFDILSGRSTIIRGRGSYKGTCFPASFPITQPTPPPPSPFNCSLPGSRELGCGRERSHYLADVDAAVNELAARRPELFDFNVVRTGSTDWWLIKDIDQYHAGVMERLRAKGYCTNYDGAEVQVKKDNKFSDNFQMYAEDVFVRRGEGSYRGTCYPPSF
jgi:hypothetical protein